VLLHSCRAVHDRVTTRYQSSVTGKITPRYTTSATNTTDTLAKLSQCDIDQGINSKNATNSQNRGTATIMRQTTRR
jgi:hypothetical protein